MHPNPQAAAPPRSPPLFVTCSLPGPKAVCWGRGGLSVPCPLNFTLMLDVAGPSSEASCLWAGVGCLPSPACLEGGREPFQCPLLLAGRRSPAPGPCPEPWSSGRGSGFASGLSGARRLRGALLEENSCCYPQRTPSWGVPGAGQGKESAPAPSHACYHVLQDPTSVLLSLRAKERCRLALPGHNEEG